MTRYREYQARLAGHPVGETFRCAAAFLHRASDELPRPPLARPAGPAAPAADGAGRYHHGHDGRLDEGGLDQGRRNRTG